MYSTMVARRARGHSQYRQLGGGGGAGLVGRSPGGGDAGCLLILLHTLRGQKICLQAEVTGLRP